MKIQSRSIAVCIILSIITCGIYSLYWIAKMNDDTNAAAQEPNATTGGMVVLLTIVTCGIYGFYWAYKQGEKLDKAYEMRMMPTESRAILYLVLYLASCLVGVTELVALALMQDSLNKLPEAQP